MKLIITDVKTTRGHQEKKLRRNGAIFVQQLGDNPTSVEALMAQRWGHPVKQLKALMPEILERAGLSGPLNPRWRQRWYCSCPCSPAFKLDWPAGGVVVWVTYAWVEEAAVEAAVPQENVA